MTPEQYLKLQEEEAGEWEGGWADQMLSALFNSTKDLPLNSKIIDLGCNLGRSCFELTKKGYTNVFGVDLVPSKTLYARKLGLNVITMNIEDLSMFSDNYFDFAFMSHSIEHTLNPLKAIEEMIRISNSGLIICPIEQSISNKLTPHTSPFFSKEQWAELLSKVNSKLIINKNIHSTFTSRLGDEVWTVYETRYTHNNL